MREDRTEMRLISVKKLSELIDVPESTIYEWVHLKFIPHYRIGRLIRFDKEEIQNWLRNRRRPGRSKRAPFVILNGKTRARARAKQKGG